MRILVVSSYMPPHTGGLENIAESIFNGLRDRGHDVRWAATAFPEVPGVDADRYRLPGYNPFERRGIPWPFLTPAGVSKLVSLVRWADVLNVHDCLYFNSAIAAAAATGARKPLLLTQHIGYVPYGRLLDQVQKAAYLSNGRAVIAAAGAITTCSPHVPEYFRSIGIEREFQVVPSTVDIERFRPSQERLALRRKWNLPADKAIVLFAARMVAKKGTKVLREICDRMGDVHFALGGDGPEKKNFEGLRHVTLLGAVPHARMHELFQLADCYLLPSVGEGLPQAVQEALFAGTPVVVSNDDAFRKNLAGCPGVGYAGDATQYEQALRATLVAPFAPEAARAWAMERWGPQRFISAYEDMLTRLASRGRS